MEKKIYHAPKWAIKLKDEYASQSNNDDTRFGILHAGRLAIQSVSDWTAWDAMYFFDDHRIAEYVESKTFRIATKQEIPEYGKGPCQTRVDFDDCGQSIHITYFSPYWDSEALRYLSRWAIEAAQALEERKS